MSKEAEMYQDKKEKGNVFITDVGTSALNFKPVGVGITFSSPITNKILGEFKEVDNKLTFEGDITESGKVFVDFICKTFNKNI
tara:strand:+ start:2264 stop:2512 length:249 start_codon:yes stop_codon:yes gene_type:complete